MKRNRKVCWDLVVWSLGAVVGLLPLVSPTMSAAQDRRGGNRGGGAGRVESAPRREATPPSVGRAGRSESSIGRIDRSVGDRGRTVERTPQRETPAAVDRIPRRDATGSFDRIGSRIDRSQSSLDRSSGIGSSESRTSYRYRSSVADRSSGNSGSTFSRDRSSRGQESNGRTVERIAFGQRSSDGLLDRGSRDRSGNDDRSDRGGTVQRDRGPAQRPSNQGGGITDNRDGSRNDDRSDRGGNVQRDRGPTQGPGDRRVGDSGSRDRSGNDDRSDRGSNVQRDRGPAQGPGDRRVGDTGSRDRSGNDDRSDRGGNVQRDRGPAQRPNNQGGSITDRRDGSRNDDRRGRDTISVAEPRPYRDRAHGIFTRSAEGRRYERGIELRPARRFEDTRLMVYFPHRYCYYPHYSTTYWGVDVVVSPYHFYFGTFPGYIHRSYIYCRAPRVVYIEVPIYVGGVYRGYRDDDYYLNSVWWRDDGAIDSSVRRAVEDLEDAFRYSDIEKLTNLTDPNTDISVFTQGRYQYSLKANDYLDMTRDFMRSTDTKTFDVFRVKRRSNSAYTLSAKHVYRGRDGETHTVYLSFALERIGQYWTITQVDTSPERL